MSRLSYHLLCAITCTVCGYFILQAYAEKKSYINVEYPAITYYNKKYVTELKLITRRYSRLDPVHYMSIIVHTLMYADNNVTVAFSVFEYVSNVYRPTFIVLRYKWCDLVERDPFIGQAIRNAFKTISPGDSPTNSYKCPNPPGVYRLYNMSFPQDKIPPVFAYEKGRFDVNFTRNSEILATGYLNFEIKQYRPRKKA